MIERNINKEIIEEASIHSEKRMQFEYNRFGLNQEQRKAMILNKRAYFGDDYKVPISHLIDIKQLITSYQHDA